MSLTTVGSVHVAICGCLTCVEAKGLRIARLEAENARLREALEFYADPGSYHAISIIGDPPCGAFDQDWSEHGDPDYPEGDERPGKRAREALDQCR